MPVGTMIMSGMRCTSQTRLNTKPSLKTDVNFCYFPSSMARIIFKTSSLSHSLISVGSTFSIEPIRRVPRRRLIVDDVSSDFYVYCLPIYFCASCGEFWFMLPMEIVRCL